MQMIECCRIECIRIFIPLMVMQAYHLPRTYSNVLYPFTYVCITACIHVYTGMYGQPVAAQFLRKFPPRLPKLTSTVNHSLDVGYMHP